MSKSKPTLILLGIFTFGLLVRVLPFLNELQESPMFFYQPDNLYYLRRVMTILYDFPKVPSYDYYFNFYEPVDFPSPPFYPFFLAVISWIISLGNPSQHLVELVSSFVTAISGALICLPIYKLMEKVVSKKYAIFASFVSVAMPLHYWYTNALDGDHHAIESLLAFLSFYYFLEILIDKKIKNLIKFAVVVILLFLFWQGAILYAGLITIFSLIILVVKKDNDFVKNIGLSFIFSSLFVFVLIVLFPPFKPSVEFGRYSFFSPLSLLICGMFLAGVSFFIEKRIFIGGGIFLLFLICLFIIGSEIVKGFGFISKQERGFVGVLEMQSILKLGWWKGVFDFEFVLRTLFFVYLFVPLFSLFVLYKHFSYEKLYIIFLIVSFTILTMIQRRFGYMYGPLIAISFSMILSHLKNKRLFNIFLAFLIFVIVDWGIQISRTKVYFSSIVYKEIRDAYTWLAKNTEKASESPFDARKKPDYSVFARWDQGYYMIYYGMKPVITNNALIIGGIENFIDCLKLTVTNSEQTFLQLLDKYKVRYLAIDATRYEHSIFDFLRFPYMEPEERIFGILDFNYGLKGNNSLSNFRLLGEFLGNDINKRIKIYEYVKGAEVKIYVGNNKTVTLLLKPQTPLRKFFFKKVAKSDKDGYVIFNLPYAEKQGMVNAGAYELFVDDRVIKFTLSEEAVRNGKTFVIDTRKGDLFKLD
jgi:asparagine N-glycosylation enzyme membrane subunit Stt3